VTETLWTLDQLAERVDAALSVGYDGQASGRVRDVPDQRAIRYYTTLGLVDRPVARRGSTALYRRRHLLQLVAIKKLQSRGLPLARIQAELAGATQQQLERIAQLPRPEQSVASPVPPYASHSAAISDLVDVDAPPAPVGPPAPAGPPGRAAPPGTAVPEAVPSGAGAFWRRAAADLPAAAPRSRPAGSAPERPGERSDLAILQGIRLADDVTLLLEGVRPLRGDEVHAIQAAAENLLEALRARGLGGRPRGREPR
jgi:hypothetical protein